MLESAALPASIFENIEESKSSNNWGVVVFACCVFVTICRVEAKVESVGMRHCFSSQAWYASFSFKFTVPVEAFCFTTTGMKSVT